DRLLEDRAELRVVPHAAVERVDEARDVVVGDLHHAGSDRADRREAELRPDAARRAGGFAPFAQAALSSSRSAAAATEGVRPARRTMPSVRSTTGWRSGTTARSFDPRSGNDRDGSAETPSPATSSPPIVERCSAS